jgi:hypothetical protein
MTISEGPEMLFDFIQSALDLPKGTEDVMVSLDCYDRYDKTKNKPNYIIQVVTGVPPWVCSNSLAPPQHQAEILSAPDHPSKAACSFMPVSLPRLNTTT